MEQEREKRESNAYEVGTGRENLPPSLPEYFLCDYECT